LLGGQRRDADPANRDMDREQRSIRVVEAPAELFEGSPG
jgi:hypothetical protein